jgi:Family of unknown function (DUF6445)
MFNPRPAVRTVEFGPADERFRVVVVDDALIDPQALVALAQRHRAAFAEAPHNAYPGLELPLPDSAVQALATWFLEHAAAPLGVGGLHSAHARLAMVTRPPQTLTPLQRLPHRDRLGVVADEIAAAGVLYLFADPELGGTAFYRPTRPLAEVDACFARYAAISDPEFEAASGLGPDKAYPHASSEMFEWIAEVPAAYNRAIFYDGGRFHCSQIERPERLCGDPAQGRLTLNLFATARKRLSMGALL